MRIKLLLALLFVSLISWTQTYNFDIYSVEEGLPQSQVTGVTEDPKGRLWVSTLLGGVSIFDGRNFIPVQAELSSLTSVDLMVRNNNNDILILGERSREIIIFKGANPDSITRIDAAKWKLKNVLAGDNDFYLNCGNDSLIRYQNGKISTILKGQHIVPVNSPSGAIYAIIDSNLYNLRDGFTTHLSSDPNYQKIKSNIPAILLNTGELWYAPEHGISSYLKNEFVHFNQKYVGSDRPVNAFSIENDGSVWLTTADQGLAKFDNKKTSYINFSKDPAMGYVRGFMKDSHDRMWVFGDGSGLLLLENLAITNYTKEDGMLVEEIWGLTENDKGEIFVGTMGGGAYRINQDGLMETCSDLYGLSDDLVVQSACSSSDKKTVYLGTNEGIISIQGQKVKHLTRNSPFSFRRVFSVLEKNDSIYFIGVSDSTSVYLHANGKTEMYLTPTQSESNYFGLITELHNEVYISGNGIFGKLKKGKVEPYAPLQGKDIAYLVDAVETSSGVLYMSGTERLFRVAQDKVSSYDMTKGLNSNVGVFIETDQNDRVFMGHEKGVDQITFSPDGEIKDINLIDGGTGLANPETNMGAVLRDSKNNLWIGTIAGLSKYDDRYNVKNEHPPKMFLNDLKLLYESQDWSKKGLTVQDNIPVNLNLDYNDNHLTFDFKAINLSDPSGVKFQYLLEGNDEKWLPITEDASITYSNLSPGIYTMKAKACNEDDVWSYPINYHFEILPPFWQTTWFRISSLLLIGGSIYGFIKLRLRKLKKEKIELQQKVEERTKEIVKQKELVEEQNKEIEKKNELITDSISYAQKIQKSILPPMGVFERQFDDYFILYQPKDMVSGDFYWQKDLGDWSLIACIDCTGHGVPGALMSIISQNILETSTTNISETNVSPAAILQESRNKMHTMKNRYANSEVKDGMAISLIAVNHKTQQAKYAGSYHDAYLLRNKEIEIIKGDRIAIGQNIEVNDDTFQDKSISIKKGDLLYVFSDGYADQKGGRKNKKYFYKPFRNFLIEHHEEMMFTQKDNLWDEFVTWKGDNEQYDDVLVIGLKF